MLIDACGDVPKIKKGFDSNELVNKMITVATRDKNLQCQIHAVHVMSMLASGNTIQYNSSTR